MKTADPDLKAQWDARRKAAVDAARAAGKHCGRPRLNPAALAIAAELYQRGATLKEAALTAKVSRRSLQRYLDEKGLR